MINEKANERQTRVELAKSRSLVADLHVNRENAQRGNLIRRDDRVSPRRLRSSWEHARTKGERRRSIMPGPWQVGDRIADRFEVFEIHHGGMGIVYLAVDPLRTAGQETVALKTLHDEFLPDHVGSARFAAECRLWIRLGRHPHIVQAFAVEMIEGKPHIVLERVTGGELRSQIGTHPLDPFRALRHGVEFCLGMEHAIRQGLRCHRDIKPGNLLVTGTGTLKITDFGLASIRDDYLAASIDLPDGPIALVEASDRPQIVWTDPRDQPGPTRLPPVVARTGDESIATDTSNVADLGIRRVDSERLTTDRPVHDDPELHVTIAYIPPSRLDRASTTSSRLTRTGLLLGTLPYMAPEQFRNAKAVDVRADIYSFGVVLFQMLTTELPFKGDTVAKFERQHTHYDPPSVVPAIPRQFVREAGRIDGIIQRCLAKDPANRFATVVALRRALIDALRRLDHDSGRKQRS
jgi:serine/threonine protein kinase